MLPSAAAASILQPNNATVTKSADPLSSFRFCTATTAGELRTTDLRMYITERVGGAPPALAQDHGRSNSAHAPEVGHCCRRIVHDHRGHIEGAVDPCCFEVEAAVVRRGHLQVKHATGHRDARRNLCATARGVLHAKPPWAAHCRVTPDFLVVDAVVCVQVKTLRWRRHQRRVDRASCALERERQRP